jgi:hypothetical protein
MLMQGGPLLTGGHYVVCWRRTAMNWLRERLIWGAILVSLAGALAACEEGPAEDAGEVIDEQGEEAVD